MAHHIADRGSACRVVVVVEGGLVRDVIAEQDIKLLIVDHDDEAHPFDNYSEPEVRIDAEALRLNWEAFENQEAARASLDVGELHRAAAGEFRQVLGLADGWDEMGITPDEALSKIRYRVNDALKRLF